MGEWKKLSANEQHNIFYNSKKQNLDCKNKSDNGRQEETNKTNMNLPIKQNQARLYASKNRLTSFPDTDEDSYKNSVEPYD